jgi:hypothetical protein
MSTAGIEKKHGYLWGIFNHNAPVAEQEICFRTKAPTN